MLLVGLLAREIVMLAATKAEKMAARPGMAIKLGRLGTALTLGMVAMAGRLAVLRLATVVTAGNRLAETTGEVMTPGGLPVIGRILGRTGADYVNNFRRLVLKSNKGGIHGRRSSTTSEGLRAVGS